MIFLTILMFGEIQIAVVVVNSSKRTHVTLATLESPRELLPFYSSVAFVASCLRGFRGPGGLRAPGGLCAHGGPRAPRAPRGPRGLRGPDHLSEFEEALEHNNPSGWLVGTSDKLLISNRHRNCNRIWSRLANRCEN